ncbi:MAG: hypothetical protein FJY55_05575 [Betaproteobacteria bacterium]|nr:hypothetical protein [Betaproteobacteria bacterium]
MNRADAEALTARDLQRHRLLWALMGTGLTASSVLRQATAQNLVPEMQGVHRMGGDVRINGAGATLGALVQPGDVISTGLNAYIMFVVGRDAYLVRESSRLELEGRSLFVSSLRLITGKLLGVYGRSDARRQLNTRTATIGIRGTGGYLEADPGRAYFCLCYGIADLEPVDRPDLRQVYSTTHHDAPRFVYGDGRVEMMESAPMENHADSEPLLLESLVGRRPPQSFLDQIM